MVLLPCTVQWGIFLGNRGTKGCCGSVLAIDKKLPSIAGSTVYPNVTPKVGRRVLGWTQRVSPAVIRRPELRAAHHLQQFERGKDLCHMPKQRTFQ
jgi:hypothetical protein